MNLIRRYCSDSTRIHVAAFIQRETNREMRREIKEHANIAGCSAKAASTPEPCVAASLLLVNCQEEMMELLCVAFHSPYVRSKGPGVNSASRPSVINRNAKKEP